MMRAAGICSPKRCAYQLLIASRSAGRPSASVYWLRPARIARSAASCTSGGAVKSGSPMFRKSMRSPPWAGSQAGLAAMACAALAHSIT